MTNFFVEQTGAANPLNGIDIRSYSKPTLADLDGDGDLDAIVGSIEGTLNYYQNTGSNTAPIYTAQTDAANPFNGINVGSSSAPTFADLDGDGDLDAIVGSIEGTFNYYQNTGSSTAPSYTVQTDAANPFNGINVGSYSTPTFADLDGDGDLDAIVGNSAGTLNYYQNTGSSTAPSYTVQTGAANPFNGIDVGASSAPTFADLDGDSDLDAIVGNSAGTLNYFMSAVPNTAPTITSGASTNFAENGTATAYTVTATDPDASTTFSYSISGTDASLFNINSSTGAVTFKTAPNFEVPTDNGANNVYDINVIAGDGSLTDTKAIAITVTNVNEAPSGLAPNRIGVINAPLQESQEVATVIDTAATGQFNATLNGNSLTVQGTFSNLTSAISASHIHRAAAGANGPVMQALTVNADANGLGGSFNQVFTLSDADVTLAKNNGLYVNIHTPNNPGGELRGQIILDTVPTAENTTAVTTVSAIDPEGAALTYSLSGGADQTLFAINATTGALSFVTAPNFEAPADAGANNIYNVQVQVTDGTTPVIRDLTVTVTNANESPSVTAANFSIEENSVFNTLIDQVLTNDPDRGDKITFGITSGNTDVNGNGKLPFAIGSNTGEIKVNDPSDLNFEKNPIFNLGFTATDAGGLSAQSLFAVNLKNVVEPVTFGKGDSDVFTLSSGDKPKPTLLFTVNSNNAKQTGEIGVFIVDDAAGTIDGIAPNQSGYAEKALSKAKVLFSIIDNLPSGFSETGLSRLLQFSDTARIRFYTINDKSATTDSILNSKAYDKVNFSPIKDLSLTEVSGGFSLNFNGLDITIKPFEDVLAIGTGLQDKNEGEVLDLTQGFDPTAFSQVKAEFTVNREAAFNNFVGFYKIENAKGDIKKSDGSIVSVGQSGYIQAAVAGQVSGIDLSAANQSTATSSGIFRAGSIFAPFIVVNGSPSAILDSNPNNDPAVYFPFLGANTDKVDHIRLLGNNTFGFEDLPSGGDFDYNDIIVRVKLTPVA